MQEGIGELDVSFAEMKEASWRDFPNIALMHPETRELVGYLHLKLNYRTHSQLGRYVRAAPTRRPLLHARASCSARPSSSPVAFVRPALLLCD